MEEYNGFSIYGSCLSRNVLGASKLLVLVEEPYRSLFHRG